MIGPLDCKLYIIKDKDGNVYMKTDDPIKVAETLASLNDAVIDDLDETEEYYDSVSGYHCEIYNDDEELVCVYGEEGTALCDCRFLYPDEVLRDMEQAVINVEGLILDNKLYVVKDKDGTECYRTVNPIDAAKELAIANSNAISEQEFENEDESYDDVSASGYLCEIYSKKGNLICVYGEEDSRMYGFEEQTTEDILEDMADVVSKAKIEKMNEKNNM